jgi:hypothetical protein
MSSDGGLVDVNNFSGLKSILSGPAGGVVGFALTSYDEEKKTPVIGLDMVRPISFSYSGRRSLKLAVSGRHFYRRLKV